MQLGKFLPSILMKAATTTTTKKPGKIMEKKREKLIYKLLSERDRNS